ncbi:MAG: DUF6335 family protein [Waterburya sp.]
MDTDEEKFAQTEALDEGKFAHTEPFDEVNDVDQLSKQAGLEMSDNEELGLKDKLEERDDSRLDFDYNDQSLAE